MPELLTATVAGPNSDAENQAKTVSGAEKDQLDAFMREFGEADVDTDKIVEEERAKLQEASMKERQLIKTAELAKFLTDPEDRRRGLVAIYGADTVEGMNDDQIDAFIAEKTNVVRTTVRQEVKTATPEPEVKPSTAEEVEEESVEEIPRTIAGRAWKRVKNVFSKGQTYLNLLVLKGRMGPTQKEGESDEHFNKRLNRRSRRIGLGMIALATAPLVAKGIHLGGWGMNQLHSGGAPNVDAHFMDAQTAKHNNDIANAELLSQPNVEHLPGAFNYDPKADPFNNMGLKQEAVDFGSPLVAGPLDGDKPAGFYDLTTRWQHSPDQFAAAYLAMGLDPTHDNTPEGIAALAGEYRANSSLWQSNFDNAMTQINDPATHSSFVHVDSMNNSSFQWVDAAKQVHIETQNGVGPGGNVIQWILPNGTVCSFKDLCGGQVTELTPAAPVVEAAPVPQAETVVSSSPVRTLVQPHGNGEVPRPAPVPEQEVVQPPAPVPQPPVPGITIPTIPGLPPIVIPEIPGITTPLQGKDHDPLAWQAPGRDDTPNSGVGVKPLVTADPTPKPPAHVEQALPVPVAPPRETGNPQHQVPLDTSTIKPNNPSGLGALGTTPKPLDNGGTPKPIDVGGGHGGDKPTGGGVNTSTAGPTR
jgi:hypothetical protein